MNWINVNSDEIKPPVEKEEENICIVKLVTTAWVNNRGLHFKKSLIYLKRRCKGFNFLEEDSSYLDDIELVKKIINFNDVKDGIYEIISINESTDWETGYIDDYDYKLVKLIE